MNDIFKNKKRIVIKIGSALLIDSKAGEIKHNWLQKLADDVAILQKLGKEIVIVSSGATGLGKRTLELSQKSKSISKEQQQAAAAIGQIKLANKYELALAKHNINTAQILLSPIDTENRKRSLNAKATIEQLIKFKAITIINENDAVATSKASFGDNDRLAARVAVLISADLLILLSDIDGLYDDNPKNNPNAKHIKEIHKITTQIEEMAKPPINNGISTGGMITKIMAAKIAVAGGCDMIIAYGLDNNPIDNLIKNGTHSYFNATAKQLNAWKKWISGSLNIDGKIIIDDGAINAIINGNSLLSAGIISVDGIFNAGDSVVIYDNKNNEIAVGLTNYDEKQIKLIIGKKNIEVNKILSNNKYKSVIHRNNLVMMKKNDD